jgi:hypothetical protein
MKEARGDNRGSDYGHCENCAHQIIGQAPYTEYEKKLISLVRDGWTVGAARGLLAGPMYDEIKARPLDPRTGQVMYSWEESLVIFEQIARKAWNLPNTIIGLAYGGLGALIHGVAYVGSLGQVDLGFNVTIGNNAIQFANHPISALLDGAITLGNTISYGGSPLDQAPTLDPFKTVAIQEHEMQHTLQGEVLGAGYVPANLLGGLASVIANSLGLTSSPNPNLSPWHGPANFMEQGPLSNPPRPW